MTRFQSIALVLLSVAVLVNAVVSRNHRESGVHVPIPTEAIVAPGGPPDSVWHRNNAGEDVKVGDIDENGNFLPRDEFTTDVTDAGLGDNIVVTRSDGTQIPIEEWGDFHDPDYPCEDLQCDCRNQFSKKYIESRTSNKVAIFFGKFVDGTLKIGKFVLLGVLIEVVAARYIPTEWISPLLTNTFPLSIPLITLAVVPLHLNQIMASAILYGFIDLPLAKGPGLAFLVGGPVTAIPVMGIFLTFFARRVFFLYLGTCLIGTITLAYAYHYLF